MNSDLGAARGASRGHRRTASSGQGVATAGDLGPEWTEEVDQVCCPNLPPTLLAFCSFSLHCEMVLCSHDVRGMDMKIQMQIHSNFDTSRSCCKLSIYMEPFVEYIVAK